MTEACQRELTMTASMLKGSSQNFFIIFSIIHGYD